MQLFIANFALFLSVFLCFAMAKDVSRELSASSESDEADVLEGTETEEDNRTFLHNNAQNATTNARRNYFGNMELDTGDNVGAAHCYDSRLATYIDTGIQYYSHNMGQLAKYILDQIVRARFPGYWFVHAEMIGGRTQDLQWQSKTNGDLFSPTSRHGCYFHDTQTYIVIIRYY